MTYEFHSVTDPVLPFIYHEDTLPVGPKCWRNWHENMEFLFFIDGSACELCDGVTYEMHAGELFIVNANCLHEVHPHETTKIACLIVDQTFFRQNGLIAAGLRLRPHLDQAALGSRFLRVMEAFHNEDVCSAAETRLAVLEFLIWLIRNYREEQGTAAGRGSGKMSAMLQAARYIHAMVPEKITVEDIAASCALSTSYLMHAFKKTFGCQVTAYVNRVRCEYAKPLLAVETLSVQECGYLSGFSDAAYFSRVFKRHTGLSPAQYRRAVLAGLRR